jgi:hypothetical protein
MRGDWGGCLLYCEVRVSQLTSFERKLKQNSTSHSVPLTHAIVSARFDGFALRSLIGDSLVFIRPIFP